MHAVNFRWPCGGAGWCSISAALDRRGRADRRPMGKQSARTKGMGLLKKGRKRRDGIERAVVTTVRQTLLATNPTIEAASNERDGDFA